MFKWFWTTFSLGAPENSFEMALDWTYSKSNNSEIKGKSSLFRIFWKSWILL